ncbi:MAG TPA: CHRD domain-containing protein, partial [Opitutaceae bacterium]|nr:CHRD domain-containing protein [Opitutaceae bacterium]
EIRGQMIAQSKRLVASINTAQETPPRATTAFGAAIINYNPGNNHVSLTISLYNFSNTLTASHFHEGAVGVAGPVVHGLGAEAVYTRNGNFIGGTFSNMTYTGNPITLLTGGAYLNFHSNIYGGGEIRGQVLPSQELPSSRMVDSSARGFVGTGNQVLIQGVSLTGSEPVRMLLTARGTSLSNYGVTGVLTATQLSLFDPNGALMVTNSNASSTFDAATVAGYTYGPTSSTEAALLVVLPPGSYTTVTNGINGATGIALTEAYDVRFTDPNQGVQVSALLPLASPLKKSSQTRVFEICGLPPAPAKASRITQ